jgi:hypothetical protein
MASYICDELSVLSYDEGNKHGHYSKNESKLSIQLLAMRILMLINRSFLNITEHMSKKL